MKSWSSRIIVLLCLLLGQASVFATATYPLVVFNGDDAAFEVINVTWTSCGPIDNGGRYRVVFVMSSRDGAQVWAGNPREYQDVVIAMVGRDSSGQLVPIVPWEDARLFVRPVERCGTSWDGFEVSDKSRRSRMAWPPASQWPVGAWLWGLRIPASMRTCNSLEVYACPRPNWQRGLCRLLEFSAPTAVEVITNQPSTRWGVQTKVLGTMLGFSHVLNPQAGRERLFFVPKRPIVEGDCVTMTSTSTPSSAAWNCQGDVASNELFPRVRLGMRSDGANEPVLVVGVGGEVSMPSQFSRIRGTAVFPDGELISFEGTTLNGCYIEWPGHCEKGGAFSLQGVAIGASTTAPLPLTYYEILKTDSAWSDSLGFRAARIGYDCAGRNPWAFGGTMLLRLPTNGCCCDCSW